MPYFYQSLGSKHKIKLRENPLECWELCSSMGERDQSRWGGLGFRYRCEATWFPHCSPPISHPSKVLLSSHRLTKSSTPTCPGAFQDGEHAHIWCFRMPPPAMSFTGVLACILTPCVVVVARAAAKPPNTELWIVSRMVSEG